MADAIGDFWPPKYFRCFRSLVSVASSSAAGNMAAASCRRCLFGVPDRRELERDLRQHRDRLDRRSVERWFGGRYEWQMNARGRHVVGGERQPEPEVASSSSSSSSCPGSTASMSGELQDGGRWRHAVASIPLEPNAAIPTLNSHRSSTTTRADQHTTASTTATSDVPAGRLTTPTVGDRHRKRRRPEEAVTSTAERHRVATGDHEGGKLKQPRRTGGRTAVRRRTRLVNSVGAARVTGKYFVALM